MDEPKITNHELGQEIRKIHEILDSHNRDEFVYRQKIDKQHKEVMAMLVPMAQIFNSVTAFNKVVVWILKALILFGAGIGALWGGIKWLRN